MTTRQQKKNSQDGISLSEWMRSVRAVRAILLAAYSAPGINTTCRIAYCPPIAVWLFLLRLLVFYIICTLWLCGQLWPYVGMGGLGTHLYRDGNAIVDAATTSPCVPLTCVQNPVLSLLLIHIIPCRQTYVAIDNPSLIPSFSCFVTCSYLRYLQPTIFPTLKTWKTNSCWYVFSLVRSSRRDRMYPSCHVLWSAPGLTSTQRKFHPCWGGRCWIVIAVATMDAHSAHITTSLDFALPNPSRSVGQLCTSSRFLCVDKSQICVHLQTLNMNLNTMVNTKLHCMLLFIRYIRLVRTLMLDNLPCANVYCHMVHWSCVLSSDALKSFILVSGCLPAWRFWNPMNSGFEYARKLRGATRSAPEGRTL